MICLCLTAPTLDENRDILRRYRSNADLVELRVDLLNRSERERLSDDRSLTAPKLFPRVKTILTCRLNADGGAWDGTEEERLKLLCSLAERQFTFVDLEDGVSSACSDPFVEQKVRIIRSIHRFESMPEDVAGTLARLKATGDIAKLAVSVRGTADVDALVEAAQALPAGGHVVLGMGKYGLPTRLLAGRMGCAWTYTSPQRGVQAAPGQVDPRELTERYHYRSIGRDTLLFAIVGDPVSHSKSPEYHNARFQRDELDAVYLPFPVDEMTAFFRLAKRFSLSGASVTVPHKQGAAAGADYVDDTVRETGACNTLVREQDIYLGTNTDVPGFLSPLIPYLERLACACVIGAGGAARAVGYALLSRGTDVLIVNRTESRAESLSADLNRAMESLSSRDDGVLPGRARAGSLPNSYEALSGYRSLIVQTSSCGMEPDVQCDPIPDYPFDGSEIVYDIIYTPERTALIRRAERAGCAVITGGSMFAAQAAVQYDLFRRTYWSAQRSRSGVEPRYNGVKRGFR